MVELASAKAFFYQCQSAGAVGVPRVDEADHVAGCPGDAFVHRVVDAAVRLAHEGGETVAARFDFPDRAVGGGAVDDDVFKIGESLIQHGIHGLPDLGRIVADNGDDRYFHWRIS